MPVILEQQGFLQHSILFLTDNEYDKVAKHERLMVIL